MNGSDECAEDTGGARAARSARHGGSGGYSSGIEAACDYVVVWHMRDRYAFAALRIGFHGSIVCS